MYCPHCGQEQISEQTRFCSRCGFPLAAVAELLMNGGVIQNSAQNANTKTISPRKRGIRQGVFIFLLSFLIIPIIPLFMIISGSENVGMVVAIAAILLTMCGILRMVYALMFESNNPNGTTSEQNITAKTQQLLNREPHSNALPPQQTSPVSEYASPGNWRDTNDLTPTSVVENTTKLLQKEK